jgi:UDP-N-acetylglucosamine acyltransferase
VSAKIHPTAVIDPGAQIGEGCEIGPYCVIGADVELGADCWLQHHVSLSGPSKIGHGNQFFAFSSVGQKTQDLKYAGEPTYLAVGDGNTFREFVTVHRGTAPGSITRVGSRGNFLAYAHIAHDCVVGDHVIFPTTARSPATWRWAITRSSADSRRCISSAASGLTR